MTPASERVVAVGTGGFDTRRRGNTENRWQSPDLPAPTIVAHYPRECGSLGWLLVELLPGRAPEGAPCAAS
jgi:hypothetical protein